MDELDSELQSDPAMDIIKSVDGVEAVTCAWQTGYINTDPALEKLKNIQTGHSFQAIDDEDGKDGLYYIEIDATIQNIWKMKLDEGILIEELKPMEDGMYLYLGSAYKDKISWNKIYWRSGRSVIYICSCRDIRKGTKFSSFTNGNAGFFRCYRNNSVGL